MMELVISNESVNSFSTWWLLFFWEDSEFPKWKIALIVFAVIVALLYEKVFRIKRNPEYKNSTWINVSAYVAFFVGSYYLTRWFGTTHLLFLLFAVTTSILVFELLQALFKKPINWKELLTILLFMNVLIAILFL